jgi:predicted Zn-dependent protease
VYETPGFTDYFFEATPLREIAALNIGSRPASRKASQRIEDLRAIPWGFSWGQCRLTLPGWLGFGSAVQQFLDHHPSLSRPQALALLRRMEKQWPFFRTLLSNIDMVMAKSDLALASRYAELVTDVKLRRRIFKAIETEWQLTAQALQLITGAKQRLATSPNDRDALWSLALIATLRNRPQQALPWYEKLQDLDPNSPWPAAYRAVVLLADWHPGTAANVLTESTESATRHPVVRALSNLSRGLVGHPLALRLDDGRLQAIVERIRSVSSQPVPA